MGTFKGIEICIVLGIYVFNYIKLRYVKHDASDNEILGWIVVSLSNEVDEHALN